MITVILISVEVFERGELDFVHLNNSTNNKSNAVKFSYHNIIFTVVICGSLRLRIYCLV